MKSCERFEMLVSAWLDGELERDEQVECVDHLVRCPACRRFYIDARGVDGLMAALRSPADARSPSVDAWPRIAAAARPTRRVPAWMLQAAAVVALAVGLYAITLRPGSTIRPTPAASSDIVLGADRDMTEERFLELTREVLEAEPRYRVAMHEVLGQAMRDTLPREAPVGDRVSPRSEQSGEAPESRPQLPS